MDSPSADGGGSQRLTVHLRVPADLALDTCSWRTLGYKLRRFEAGLSPGSSVLCGNPHSGQLRLRSPL